MQHIRPDTDLHFLYMCILAFLSAFIYCPLRYFSCLSPVPIHLRQLVNLCSNNTLFMKISTDNIRSGPRQQNMIALVQHISQTLINEPRNNKRQKETYASDPSLPDSFCYTQRPPLHPFNNKSSDWPTLIFL